jgi:hypothetical protein
VLPVKISTLFSAFNAIVVKMMDIKTTQIYPEDSSKYFPPKHKKNHVYYAIHKMTII